MRKVILMMLLAVSSSNAVAEWVEVGGNKDTTAYADLATIHKAGDRVKMWELFDFKTARKLSNGELVMSMRGQVEYDCKEEQSRKLLVSYHSGNMGRGETVRAESDTRKWMPVPPETLVKTMWKTACGKQ